MKHVHHGKSSRDLIDGSRVLLEAGLGPGRVVLDAGCGDGYLSIAASRIVGPAGRVVALDAHGESLEALRTEAARSGISNLQVLEVDLTEGIPLGDGSVDFSILANVLHGFVVNGEDGKALGEIARVLKAGGSLLVIEFFKEAGVSGPPFEHRVSEVEAREALESRGFAFGRVFDAGLSNYAILAARRPSRSD